MKKTAIYYATVTGTLIRSRDRRGRLRSAESGHRAGENSTTQKDQKL